VVINDEYEAMSLFFVIYLLVSFYYLNFYYNNAEINKTIDDVLIITLLYIFGCVLLILIR